MTVAEPPVSVIELIVLSDTDKPFVPDVKANLTDYVVEKGMDGIFHYLAREEAAIRSEPVKRTTALLQKVFGAP